MKLAREIEIFSPLDPLDILDNLRTRGKEWRPSVVPEDLRKLKVETLGVIISGWKFNVRWNGNVSPLYNPVCFGTLEPANNGTRIVTRFGRDISTVLPLFLMVALSVAQAVITPKPISFILLAIFLILLLNLVMSKRNVEPLRSALIEVLHEAAQPQVASKSPAFRPMFANGP